MTFLSVFADSIVIGFWVGLAVFVIFMFFVLTLLTKTGAPHQEWVSKQAFLFKPLSSGSSVLIISPHMLQIWQTLLRRIIMNMYLFYYKKRKDNRVIAEENIKKSPTSSLQIKSNRLLFSVILPPELLLKILSDSQTEIQNVLISVTDQGAVWWTLMTKKIKAIRPFPARCWQGRVLISISL